MSVLLLVLKLLGWCLLALLAVLVVMMFIPLWIALEVDYDRFCAQIKVLCFSFRLYPREKKPAREKKKPYQPQHLKTEAPKQESAKDAAKPPPEAAGPSGRTLEKKQRIRLSQMLDIFSTAGKLMKSFLRVIRVEDVKLVLPVHGEDAAQTAIEYGQIQAALGTAFGALQNLFEVGLKQVDIIPDFTGEHKYRRYFYCKIGATPFIMITTGLYALWRLKTGRGE